MSVFEKAEAIDIHKNAGKSKPNMCWAKFEHRSDDIERLIKVIDSVLKCFGER